MGPPFMSRRKGQEGLCFPTVIRDWPSFICEACTVRRVLKRELRGPRDVELLALERMRILDMVSSWARNTHRAYQSHIGTVRRFERRYDFQFLTPSSLERPPGGPEIPLMWCITKQSLLPGATRRATDMPVFQSFNTIRNLRSAASQFWAWDLMLTHPNAVVLNKERKLLIQPCRPSDGLDFTLYTKGLRTRIGDEAHPSVALLDQHVRAMEAELDAAYRQAIAPTERRLHALAGFALLLFWLGWLRSGEVFQGSWDDCRVFEPHQGPQLDLPPGCGAFFYRLQPETKSDRTTRPDVLLAYKTMSGYFLGKWYHRARFYRHLGADHVHIFTHLDGTAWDSLFFRKRFLYPSLHRQRRAGDPYLKPFDGQPGNTIEAKFWSLHCFRRGARSHVSRGGRFGKHRMRKATQDQVYEHARWRYRRSNERIDIIYREWVPLDRIKITLYCM